MSKHLNPLTLLKESIRASFYVLRRELDLASPHGKGDCPPFVLMHGFAGFHKFKVGPVRLFDYFNGVQKLLGEEGYRVYAPEIEPFARPQERAQAWKLAIDEIRRETGAKKVHLIAHSQAGVDARLLLAPKNVRADTPLGPLHGLDLAECVASLTTFSAPHEGVALIDRESKPLFRNEALLHRLMWMANRLPWMFDFTLENIPDVLGTLSRRYMMTHFNPVVWDTQGVPCRTVAADPGDVRFVNVLFRDTYEEILEVPREEGGGPNDSLIAVDSAHFRSEGSFGPKQEPAKPRWKELGTLRADHLSQIGLNTGQVDRLVYDHLTCFSGLAQRLDRAYVADMTLLQDGSWERHLDLEKLQRANFE